MNTSNVMRKALYIHIYIYTFLKLYFQANTVTTPTPTTTATRRRSINEEGKTNKANCIKEPKLFVVLITAILLFGYAWMIKDI